MNREDIDRMAREAEQYADKFCSGIGDTGQHHWFDAYNERFAALVAAEKEQQMLRDGWRQCAKGQRTTQYCGLLDAAVKAEREACAKVCDGWLHANGDDCAASIRARGEQEEPR